MLTWAVPSARAPARSVGSAAGVLTVTVQEAVRPPSSAVAVIVAVPSATAVTEPAVTEPAKKEKPKKADNGALLQTGKWYVALLILLVLLACSTVLFVMRKRDIYND